MKNIITTIILISVIHISYGQEKKDKAIKGGISLTTSVGINNSNVGLQLPAYDWDKYSYVGFQCGFRSYIKPKTKWAIGVKASILDISYTESTTLDETSDEYFDEYDIFDEEVRSKKFISVGFLSFGPVGTYALAPNVAVDCYYNLRPTYVRTEVAINDIGTQPGFGISHLCGAAVRIGVFNIGYEYIFGSIKPLSDNIADAVGETQGIGNMKTDYMRIVIGCKF